MSTVEKGASSLTATSYLVLGFLARLPMGLLYERAAIEFWAGIAAGVSAADATGSAQARAEDGPTIGSGSNGTGR
jgi:hypothetical protein